jgi:hypothetical protein
MDETEREPLLRERIKTMPPERFEQLVYELAHREDQRVERLEHPDGGADTILPRWQGEAERVWQAKRHPKAINWGKCEKSLADAIKRWRPARVTFAFPRDFSEKPRAMFDKRLVSHPGAVVAKVTVDHWNLSHIMAARAAPRSRASVLAGSGAADRRRETSSSVRRHSGNSMAPPLNAPTPLH